MVCLVNVNDLGNASNTLDPIIFADDTCPFLSHQHIDTIYKKLNEELTELKRIGDWLKANKLYLNNNKTKYILFHKKQQIYKVSSFKNSR